MKDYSVYKEDEKHFIRKYKIKNNKIHLKMGGFYNGVMPYTHKNEENILRKMQKQVQNSKEYIKEEKKNFSKTFTILILNIILYIAIVLINSVAILPFSFLNDVIAYLSSITLFGDILCVINMAKINSNLKDLEKNKEFYLNQKEINTALGLYRRKALAKTRKKTKKIIQEILENHQELDLNNTDKIKYEELKKILLNIKKMRQTAPETFFKLNSNTEKFGLKR